MTYRADSPCLNCRRTYEKGNTYHGYYCPDCRLGPGERRTWKTHS